MNRGDLKLSQTFLDSSFQRTSFLKPDSKTGSEPWPHASVPELWADNGAHFGGTTWRLIEGNLWEPCKRGGRPLSYPCLRAPNFVDQIDKLDRMLGIPRRGRVLGV